MGHCGRLEFVKAKTTDMLADILTEAVPEALMEEMLRRMGFEYRAGVHQLSLKVPELLLHSTRGSWTPRDSQRYWIQPEKRPLRPAGS